jgi:hypothetical protein
MDRIGTTGPWQPEAEIEIMGAAVIPDERLVRPVPDGGRPGRGRSRTAAGPGRRRTRRPS